MSAAKSYWLVFYAQCRYGTGTWITANTVTDRPPARFLLGLLDDHPNHESRVHWATEISKAEFESLKGRL